MEQESLFVFEKVVDSDGSVMVLLPQNLGLVAALAEPDRSEWREQCNEAFSDDPDLVHFTNALCDAMEQFLTEE